MIKKKYFKIYLLNFLFLLGFTLSTHLTQSFYEVRNGSSSFNSSCNINEKMNCDQVFASHYAEFISGIPLSTLAAGLFVGLFLISLLLYTPDWKKEALSSLLVINAFALIFGAYYIFIMAFRIHTFCLFCLSIDAIYLLSLGLTLSFVEKSPGGFFKARPRQWKAFSLIILGSMFFTLLGFKGFDQSQLSPQDIRLMAQSILANPAQSFDIEAELITLGKPNAKITIIEMSDFQCPHCKLGALVLKRVLDRYPEKVKIIFRNFPLHSACNSLIQDQRHPFSCEAARVAICAQRMGEFKKIYESLFENQDNFYKNSPTQLATQAGLDEKQLKACLESTETRTLLEQDIQFGLQQKINATPTFWIDGHKIEGPYPFQIWSTMIDTLLL